MRVWGQRAMILLNLLPCCGTIGNSMLFFAISINNNNINNKTEGCFDSVLLLP